jgi:hypothetical protein
MTPRQPIRDHISRVLGANSLLETGNMGFGMRSFCIPIASFPFPGKRGLCFLGRFFRLVLSYSVDVHPSRFSRSGNQESE